MCQNKNNRSLILLALPPFIMVLTLVILLWYLYDRHTIVEVIEQKYVPTETLSVTNAEPYDSHLSTDLGQRGLFDTKDINPDDIYGDINVNYTFSDGTDYNTTFSLDDYRNHEMPDINSTVQKSKHYIGTYKLKNGEVKTVISKEKLKIKNRVENYEPEIQWQSIKPYRKPLTMEVVIEWSRSNGKITIYESTTRIMTFTN